MYVVIGLCLVWSSNFASDYDVLVLQGHEKSEGDPFPYPWNFKVLASYTPDSEDAAIAWDASLTEVRFILIAPTALTICS